MPPNQFLHELLKEDQEPFRLKNYIADRRCGLKKPSPPAATNLHLGKRKPNPIHESSTSRRNTLCKHACFLSFQNSPDVMKSPFFDFNSPAKSPCKSPNGAVFLHIPSKTAALLVEAAMRIQKQQQPKPKAQGAKGVGLGLLGSFLKRLKDRSKSKTRAISKNGTNIPGQNATIHKPAAAAADEETISNRRPSSANWTENNELDFEASTSSYGSEFSEEIIKADFDFSQSPFRFNLQKSPPPFAGTPEFCSPVASPSRRVNQENKSYLTSNSDNVQGEEEGKEEQCSPVSVFDPPFEDDGRLSGDAEENEDDDYDLDLECSYAKVQRVKQQLLYRLRRFEKLAELDTVELERDSLEGSDDMSVDMKKLVSDLITEEKREKVNSCDNEVVMSRVCNKLDSWREVEPNTIDMMIGFDLKGEFDGWTRFNEHVDEISAEIEVAVFGLLVEELSQELV